MANWQHQASQYLWKGDYSQAAILYEKAIEAHPEIKSYYWYLGLILLLQGQEAEAQTTWLLAMAEGDSDRVEIWTRELIDILQEEAIGRAELADYKVAWVIRQHIREIAPDNLDNLLKVIDLAIKADLFTEDETILSEVVQLLQLDISPDVDINILLQVLEDILESYPLHSHALDFTEACAELQNISLNYSQAFSQILFDQTKSLMDKIPPKAAINFLKICYRIEPQNISILASLANLYQDTGRYLESLEFAQQMLKLSQLSEDKIAAQYLIVRGLVQAGGYWEEADRNYQDMEREIHILIEGNNIVNKDHFVNLIGTVVFSNYFGDNPQKSHQLRNKVSAFCQAGIHRYYADTDPLYHHSILSKCQNVTARPLKIGYLSSCFRRHSVGWIARWLFKYHDQDKVRVYAYSTNYANDNVQGAIANSASHFHDVSKAKTVREIAEHIYQDEIDILIDLDSLTFSGASGVMALKSAPIQVTWLGSDASGLPAIDYFIADPYILPESAQDYYKAEIWRLPKTYVAVDGFEVGVPTLRRDLLDIENDAVVYLSAQTGYKRHPDTVRLQMKIIKEVPNSYLLIKGLADEESIKYLFKQIAEEAGLSQNRLRFLSMVASEEIHRANLGIADIILDTYPYNGATTTLETLWMCIPLVTKVGQQFAARNSYTMMMNAGITEGISWSDDEYVEWGIRLGKDEALRQEVVWKLRQSRHTSPLWNGKQFTREMEKAYEEMWRRYLDTSGGI
ncbi:MAG TPA: O-linked N-acetylglucosamine transferase, SPINDLY family protein [Cyanobacteria bacterium UBA11149]|nr:O-linked N-acetylglucosamine transferase, SPINDLY family protein [Cyanobacteria bacterium UBA11367]HBE57362.1 O-linked N-acetylglucosamine transferase, SPINDLY family protein [Cyanobacteria bacterium UBA11366]HBK66986.1 O-linked N-acetylglucosamine transferase, SPINDLY family protein [Cyanobacteria bacterium UBA11166]HBR76826.1 O-linked N-acetylglucosamine transferase, SPINDLY family protein [Cyanobacteria bacterium UBA11159]HBS72583.1 O-linked N-acetylglucosamine transferase, SPINDLY family